MEDLKVEEDDGVSTPLGCRVGFPGNLMFRELGLQGRPWNRSRASEAGVIAEERLVNRDPMETLNCKLLGPTRSTFLMVFSPDKELLASTHGDHNIYVSEVKTGECLRTLKGHPRTPWCVAFHPSHSGLIASGCLGGHVRVWDLSGGSEVWRTEGVIASLAFHPVERLLVVATLNQLHFWDWSTPEPFVKVSTQSDKEKVRYVKFDAVGHHLVTGIANLSGGGGANAGNSGAVHNIYVRPTITQREGGDGVYRGVRRVNMPSDGSSPPTYGRYVRLRGPPMDRAEPSSSSSSSSSARTRPAAASPTTSSSASQTLSDLAAAASHQLMAENAAAAASAEAAAEAAAAAINALRRRTDDQFLSDHPYGLPRSQRLTGSYRFIPWGGFELHGHRDYYNGIPRPFSHSPESSFVEVSREPNADEEQQQSASTTEVYANPDRNTLQANSRFQATRERRLQELLDRRQTLVSQIEELRSARESLSGRLPLSDRLPPPLTSLTNRPIDEWAINRRLSLESSRLRQDGDASTSAATAADRTRTNSRFTHMMDFLSRDRILREFNANDNDDADSITAQFGDGEDTTEVVGPTIEPTVMAQPESLSPTATPTTPPAAPTPSGLHTPPVQEPSPNPPPPTSVHSPHSNTDHTYTRSPPQTGTSNENHLDIVLLNRHIDHMQRICRASLADCAVTRQRRQVVRLQSIRRMLEDLQRQIRSLRTASIEELNRRSRAAETIGTAIGNVTRSTSTSMSTSDPLPATASSSLPGERDTEEDNEDEEEEPIEEDRPVTLDDINYDERLGEGYHMRSLCRSLPRTSRALGRLHRALVPPLRPHLQPNVIPVTRRSLRRNSGGHARVPPASIGVRALSASSPTPSLRRTNSRLSRVHNQLVSQMRATFRAMEMSPDLSQRGRSPVAECNADASRLVMEKTCKEANKPHGNLAKKPKLDSSTMSSTRGELRALSQRLEKMLRARREASSSHHADRAEASTSTARADAGIPRPDKAVPYDIRKRWRHDGTLNRDDTQGASSSQQQPPVRSSSGSDSDPDNTNRQAANRSFYLRREEMLDYYGFPPGRRPGDMSSRFSRSDSWRASMRERLDTRRGLRRDAERERQRLSRERDLLRRRRRYRSFESQVYANPYVRYGDPSRDTSAPSPSGGAEGALSVDIPDGGGAERLPPLRELIWRRLRRRNAQLSLLDEEIEASNGRPARSHREALSWMVDQMHLDQSSSEVPPATPGNGGGSPGRPPRPPVLHDHAAFRHRYVNRLREESVAAPPHAPIPTFQREPYFMHNTPSNMLLTHRIQAWDFTKGDIPDIGDGTQNLVVREAKIHNDASVDIAEDGSILVTLVPSNMPMTTVVGVYSLQPDSRGRCYATYSLESSAVSVSLSPTARHLLVGLSMRAGRISLSPTDRTLMAQVFRIKLPWETLQGTAGTGRGAFEPQRGRLILKRDLHQNETVQTSLNCIGWIPVAGQGIVYATNTGLLKILR